MHGWAINSQGIKILWCPLNRLLAYPGEVLRKKGSPRIFPTATNLYALPFSETLRKLAITLRELHQAVRISCDSPCMVEDIEALHADHRAFEMVPIFIDSAFAYLRRLPDLLVPACSPLLFEDWQSVPREFKGWIKKLDWLESRKPTCNITVLQETLVNHSAWFNELRDKSPTTGKKGIRDTLEHRSVRLVVGKQQVEDGRPHYTVTLDSRSSDVAIHKDILPYITDSVTGLCRLMTGIYTALNVGNRYEWGDFLGLVGNDDDIVGYWPQIHA
jgi:hypothetical protein